MTDPRWQRLNRAAKYRWDGDRLIIRVNLNPKGKVYKRRGARVLVGNRPKRPFWIGEDRKHQYGLYLTVQQDLIKSRKPQRNLELNRYTSHPDSASGLPGVVNTDPDWY